MTHPFPPANCARKATPHRAAILAALCALGATVTFSSVQSQEPSKRSKQGEAAREDTARNRRNATQTAPVAAGAPQTVAMTGGGPDTPLPPGGQPVLGDDPLESVRLAGASAGSAKLSRVTVTGQPFARAIRVDTGGRTRSEDAIRLEWDNLTPIKSSDTLFLRFWARTVETLDESGQGRFQFWFPNKTPRTEAVVLGKKGVTPGAQWERFDFPLALGAGAQANAAALTFNLGNTDRQVIEIGGLEVLNFGTRVRPSQLPFKKTSYEGREADAPWRAEAAKRIEQNRKGDLTVKVVDAQGRAVEGAQVKVAMKRHAYGFGSMLEDGLLQKNKSYRDNALKLFNQATVNVKWVGWESRGKSLPPTLKLLRDNNFQIHAHAIVWPGWRRLPKSLEAMQNEPEKLRQTVRDHVREAMKLTKGRIDSVDVVNETFSAQSLQGVLGKEEMAQWFKIAHEVDPKVILMLNENSLESGRKVEHVLSEVKFLRAQGAPIGGIGTQAHVSASSIPQIIANWQRLAQLGLPMKITEYDTVTPDDELQGEFMRDLMIAWFSLPQSDAFIMWGFWDGRHWLNDSPLFYADWSPKPGLKHWNDLLFSQWWTNAQGATTGQGDYKTRGFLGDYEITVTHGGKSKTVPAALAREGQTVTIRLN
jgi:hypothetical protein